MKHRTRRSIALRDIRSQGYRSRRDAEGTKLAERYDRYKKKAESLSKKLKAERLHRAIKEFHDSVHVEEINRQLSGIRPSDVISPPTIDYDLAERAEVARLFSRAVEVKDRKELHPLRMSLIRTLTQLCKRRESPCRRLATRGRKAVVRQSATVRRGRSRRRATPDLEDETQMQSSPQVVAKLKRTTLVCPFCRWTDNAVGESQREKEWRVDSLDRHMRTKHLQGSAPFYCPYDGCLGIIGAPEYFADHCKRLHRLR